MNKMDYINFITRKKLPPQNLYKFGCFDSERNYVDLIKNNNLYLSCPEDFNDPFDCAIAPDFSQFTDEQFQTLIRGAWEKEPSIRAMYPQFDKEIVELFRENQSKITENYKEYYRTLGVCCFSEEKDNILMWSHYARGHRGFCLEFVDLHLKPNWMHKEIIPQPITYSKKYPKFEPSNDPNKWIFEWALMIASTKSCIWRYEKEWRFIYPPGGAKKKLQYDDADLKSIYLGVGCKGEDIEFIKCLIKDKNPKPHLWQAKMIDFKFEIEFEELPND